MEIWKVIQDYSAYEVSSLGRVKSRKYGKVRILNPILRGKLKTHPYQVVALSNISMKKFMYVHTLVATAFCEGKDFGLIVHHKDCDTLNNVSDNLQWVTPSFNVKDGFLKGRKPSNMKPPHVQHNILFLISKGFIYVDIAKILKVSIACISHLKRRHYN